MGAGCQGYGVQLSNVVPRECEMLESSNILTILRDGRYAKGLTYLYKTDSEEFDLEFGILFHQVEFVLSAASSGIWNQNGLGVDYVYWYRSPGIPTQSEWRHRQHRAKGIRAQF